MDAAPERDCLAHRRPGATDPYAAEPRDLQSLFVGFVPSATHFEFGNMHVPATLVSEKVVAVRLSGATISDWLGSFVTLDNLDKFWQETTHVVVDGLCLRHDGVYVGDPLHVGSLSINKYLPVLKKVADTHPHLKWIWAMPPIGSYPGMLRMLNAHIDEFIGSLHRLSTLKYIKIDGISMGMYVYDMIHQYGRCWAALMDVPLRFWLDLERQQFFGLPTQGGHWELTDRCQAVLHALTHWGQFEYVIIPSFGFMDKHTLATSRGTFEWFMANHECSWLHFVAALNSTWARLPRQKVLMGLDTCAVQFIPDENDFKGIKNFAIKPMHEVDRLEKLNCMQLHYEGMKMDDNSTLWSYDDMSVRMFKLKFAKDNLAGVCISDPRYDISILNPSSLFKCAYRTLRLP